MSHTHTNLNFPVKHR
jgi:hypothetical protein